MERSGREKGARESSSGSLLDMWVFWKMSSCWEVHFSSLWRDSLGFMRAVRDLEERLRLHSNEEVCGNRLLGGIEACGQALSSFKQSLPSFHLGLKGSRTGKDL